MQIANLSQELAGAGNEIRILPDGVFRANDGRPQGLQGWKMDSADAARVIAASLAGGKDILIDYEHQSIHTAQNGQPAPAAGWFNRLEWRDGEGMFAVGIKWNDKAKAMIASREYRYISPVFTFDGKTGEVQCILSVAITNNPALPSLADLSQVAINSTQVAHSADPYSDRGVEMLRRLNESNAIETARLSTNHPSGKTKAIDSPLFVDDGDPRNQRGMELIRRMAAS
ncbi:MAG: phage protease [Burkholderiales bacterium]